MYTLVELEHSDLTPQFIEGVVLAANCATKPLDPSTWGVEMFGEEFTALEGIVVEQIHKQYQSLKSSEWDVFTLLGSETEHFADFAEGFMTLWPVIEDHWQDAVLNEGSTMMLQALLTSLMLAIDEEQTQLQMRDAGVEQIPTFAEMKPQLNLMINEVTQAADALMVGSKANSVNPYKDIGRNDLCPCGSLKKFKKCCGSN